MAVAALTLSVCGGSDKTAATVPSVPVAVVPTPSAAPTETPLAASCNNLSPGSINYRCLSTGAAFQRDVEDAISLLKTQRPEIFDDEKVLNVGAYVVGATRNLDRKGICATYDSARSSRCGRRATSTTSTTSSPETTSSAATT